MTTVSDWITETKDHLYGPYRLVLDELGAAMDASQTTLTLTYQTRIVPGSVLCVGGEDMAVLSWDGASREATVRRGWRGSVATAHVIGSEVEVNPRFTNGQIKRRLLEEVRGWPTSLFRVDQVTLDTFDGAVTYVDWDEPIRYLLTVQVNQGVNDLAWHSLPFARRRVLGDATRIDFGTYLHPTHVTEVHVGLDFDTSVWDDDTDLETDVGLASTMLDIGPLGAALRLVGFSEIVRTDRSSQGEPRWAEESPPGHAAETVQALWRFRNQRLADESDRLRARYPMMS